MTPAGPNRRGPSARRAHRQACARSANSVRCSGLTPKVLKPTITAVTRALAPTGANYRASPGSRLDFARIAEYALLARPIAESLAARISAIRSRHAEH